MPKTPIFGKSADRGAPGAAHQYEILTKMPQI
jgi:hypothetical protein